MSCRSLLSQAGEFTEDGQGGDGPPIFAPHPQSASRSRFGKNGLHRLETSSKVVPEVRLNRFFRFSERSVAFRSTEPIILVCLSPFLGNGLIEQVVCFAPTKRENSVAELAANRNEFLTAGTLVFLSVAGVILAANPGAADMATSRAAAVNLVKVR